MNIHRIINQCHRLSRQFLLTAVALTLLTACDKQGEIIPLVTDTTYERIEFQLPGNKFQVELNGELLQESSLYIQQSIETIDFKVLYEGKEIYAVQGAKIPEDRTFRFNFVEVLGHGMMNLPAEQQHKLSVTVQEPTDNVSIIVKGIEDNAKEVKIESGKSYIVAQTDIEKGGVSIDVSKGGTSLWSGVIDKEDIETSISLIWTGDQEKLIHLVPPTDDLRDQLVGPFDTWVSFTYSSKYYPEHKSLILELVQLSFYNQIGNINSGFKEGKEPVQIEMKADEVTDFMLFCPNHESDNLMIYKIYDPENPEEPLLTNELYPSIFSFNEWSYNDQGENNYKFRCYKFVPLGSPEITDDMWWAYYEPCAIFEKLYSFP